MIDITTLSLARAIRLTAWITLMIVAFQAVVATPLLAVRLATDVAPWVQWITALLAAGALLVTLGVAGRPLGIGMARLLAWIQFPSTGLWLILIIVIGIGLRVAWAWYFVPVPSSDGKTYLTLAQQLAEGQPYVADGRRAYWPPGFSLLLTPIVFFFGTGSLVILLFNLSLFALTVPAVYRLAQVAGGEAAAQLASLLLVLWPNYVGLASVPEKEQVVICLLSWAMVLLFAHRQSRWLSAGGSGLLIGAATLVQPSLQLLPVVVFTADLAAGRSWRNILMRLAAVIFGMLVVISPWTVRNYTIFEQFVFISTNGGSVLYRANNPLATGGYIEHGAVNLSHYGELEADARGKELAKEWIVNNSNSFLLLAIEKQIRFLGDDSMGIYASLRRGQGSNSAYTYAFWKGVANVYWWLLFGLLTISIYRNLRFDNLAASPIFIACIFSFLYLYALHSIFESNGKYHVPVMGLLAIIFAVIISKIQFFPQRIQNSVTK